MSKPKLGTVYLIHFDERFKHAQHYIGYTGEPTADNRIARHREGNGARLIRVIMDAGITWRLARTWEGVTRAFERKLKKRKNSRALCPVCNASLAKVLT